MQERLRLARALTIVAGAVTAGALALSTTAHWTVLAAASVMIATAVLGGW
ncbi:MAG: hypothetical protein QOI98_1476, partial [Solirubrobacteraceae bacterium]|nr:hypothetical protein [Solirubrobacteraceae bacterium]